MSVYFRVSPWRMSFYSGQIIEAMVVAESRRTYVVEYTDFSHVDFNDSTKDRPYTARQRVWKWRCTIVAQVAR